MVQKQVCELLKSDLDRNPVWYFPTEDDITVENEGTVRPVPSKDIISRDFALIVKCTFLTDKNEQFDGFLHWQAPFTIGAIQPVLFLTDNTQIDFWEGMFIEKKQFYKNLKKKLGINFFPLTYKSESYYGLDILEGKIEGFYYCDKKMRAKLIKI